MRLELLKTFRIVAEQGSLAGAADILGRTPSAISMSLSQLEAELGAPLFETDRKNRLTPLGERVLEESVRATDAYDRSVDAIERHATSLAGTVRIAAVPSATSSPSSTTRRFGRCFPGLRSNASGGHVLCAMCFTRLVIRVIPSLQGRRAP